MSTRTRRWTTIRLARTGAPADTTRTTRKSSTRMITMVDTLTRGVALAAPVDTERTTISSLAFKGVTVTRDRPPELLSSGARAEAQTTITTVAIIKTKAISSKTSEAEVEEEARLSKLSLTLLWILYPPQWAEEAIWVGELVERQCMCLRPSRTPMATPSFHIRNTSFLKILCLISMEVRRYLPGANGSLTTSPILTMRADRNKNRWKSKRKSRPSTAVISDLLEFRE